MLLTRMLASQKDYDLIGDLIGDGFRLDAHVHMIRLDQA